MAITYSHLSLLALTNSDENGESLLRELLTALLLNYLHIGSTEGSQVGIFPSFITLTFSLSKSSHNSKGVERKQWSYFPSEYFHCLLMKNTGE